MTDPEEELSEADDLSYDEKLDLSRRLAKQQLNNNSLEAFVLVTFDGNEAETTLMADFVHEQTEMPMPQVLLSTLIFDYSKRTSRSPMRIGQAATYAAGQIFNDLTEYDFITDFDEMVDENEP